MPGIRITPRQLGALARYHELIQTCRRLGNIARARTRVLRGEWSACGMEPASRASTFGRHVFHGVVLTPRSEEAADRGLEADAAFLCCYAGVLMDATMPVPGVVLSNDQMPELQVGLSVWLDPEARDARGAAVLAIFEQLREAGFGVVRDDDPAGESPAPGAPELIVAVRRLSLASLLDEDRPGAAAGRFFANALKPLEALEDEQIETLLLATGHGDVYERELPR